MVVFYTNVFMRLCLFATSAGIIGLGARIVTNKQEDPLFTEVWHRVVTLLHDVADPAYVWDLLYVAVYVFMFISLVLYGMLWMINGYSEVEQLGKWMDTPRFRPQSPLALCVSIASIGIFFGLLFVYLPVFPVFMGIFSLYVVFDFFYWWIRRANINSLISSMLRDIKEDFEVIDQELSRIPDDSGNSTAIKLGISKEKLLRSKEAASVFKEYYIKRNHYLRTIGELCAALPLFIIATFHVPLPYGVSEVQFRTAGYMLLWLTVFVAEVLVYRWRSKMNSRLADLAEELDTIGKRYKWLNNQVS